MATDLSKLEKIIHITFKNKELLQTALTHRSFLNENRQIEEHNERLEFLGDAVLELVTTEHLFDSMSGSPEGQMTSLRAALVRKENLDKAARSMQLGQYLNMSKGEDQGGGRNNPYILANAVEALIGAIYLDRGFAIARKFIHKFVLVYLNEILDQKLFQDSKSRLQELSQEKLQLTPIYEILSEQGPDHEKIFEAGVYFADKLQGKGKGNSKQSAELKAAQDALANLDW